MNNLCKVLIVDDEYIIRQGIAHFLDWKKEGFIIVGEASHGKEALEIIEETKPQIILCDIVMPIMDGIEFTKIVKEKYPWIRVIVLSSYSDFDNVKQMFLNGASDYILKPTLNYETLMKSLKKVITEIKDIDFTSSSQATLSEYLLSMLLGYSRHIEIDHPLLHCSQYFLLACQNKESKRRKEIEIFYNENIKKIINNGHSLFFKTADDMYLCVLGFDKPNDFILALHKYIDENMSFTYFVLSNHFNCIDNLKEIYESQIITQLNSCFYLKQTQFMSFPDCPIMQTLDKFDMHMYDDALYQMKLEEALDLLKQFVKKSLLKQVYEKDLKSLVGNALYNFIAVLEERNLDADYIRVFKLSTLSTLESSRQYESYYHEFLNVYKDLKIIIDNYQIELNQDTMNKIIEYLYNHYQEALTLSDLADYFNFNYSYLSSYFNERSDLSFNECLNKIRIEKAIELLRDFNVSIKDIGHHVGFSDHSYFCKVFKKKLNMTPTEYRKGLVKNDR